MLNNTGILILINRLLKKITGVSLLNYNKDSILKIPSSKQRDCTCTGLCVVWYWI